MGSAAVPQLVQLLRNPDPRIRAAASRVLARIGPEAVGAVPDLIELLEDEQQQVRRAAARALGQIGPDAAEAIPALVRLLEQIEDEPGPMAPLAIPPNGAGP